MPRPCPAPDLRAMRENGEELLHQPPGLIIRRARAVHCGAVVLRRLRKWAGFYGSGGDGASRQIRYSRPYRNDAAHILANRTRGAPDKGTMASLWP